MLYYQLGFPMGLMTILINIPLFFLAYHYMDHSYPLKAVFGMLAYSFSLDFFSFLVPLAPVKDTLLSCIVGGTLNGIGAAFLYRVGSSSGGADIIGAIFNKYYSIAISTPGFIINIVLMSIAAFSFWTRTSPVYFAGFLHRFSKWPTLLLMASTTKNIIIISNQSPAIAQEIIKIVGRGVTFLHGEGAFTHQPRKSFWSWPNLPNLPRSRELLII